MKLMTMLQAYPFDELMPVINEMFPEQQSIRSSCAKAMI